MGIAAAIAVGLIVLAIAAAEPVLNSSAFKSRLENTIGELLDMRFSIEGKIKLGFWPLLSVVANNLSVSTSNGKIAYADRIEIDFSLPELISLKVHLEDLQIQNPKLTFDPKTLDKIIALAARRTDKSLPLESLVIESFSLSDAGFYYSDDQSLVDLDGMNFGSGRIVIIENRQVALDDVLSFFQDLNFKGEVSARQIRSQGVQLSDVKSQVTNENGLLTFAPLEMKYSGSGVKLRAALDLSKEKPSLESQISITGLNIAKLAMKFSPGHKIRGNANISANISADLIEIDQILEGLVGSEKKDSPASKNSYPVSSFNLKKFTIAASDVAYSIDKTTVQIPRLNLTGDRLTIIERGRLQINDFESLIASTNYKVDAAVNRIFAGGHDIRDVRMKIKVDKGNLIADDLQMSYLGFSTKISGGLNLLRKMPDARLRIESAVSDIQPLAARMLPDVDINGGLVIKADVIATGVQVDKLIERTHSINRTARPIEEVYPVNRIEIKSINVSGSNINFSEGITKLDNANIKLTGDPLRLIEKNKLVIKDFGTLWRTARFDANVKIGSLSVKDEKFDSIKSILRGDRGSLKSDSIDFNYFGARTKVAGILNMQNSFSSLNVRIEMPEVD